MESKQWSDQNISLEKRKIISYYKRMELEAKDTVDAIYARVMAHVNKHGTDYSNAAEENSISVFRGTHLSNFYAVPVVLDGKTYPSVEHAYQGAKFFGFDWSLVTSEQKSEIREILRLRGQATGPVYNEEFFMDPKISAGHIKITADVLRNHHHVSEEWEDNRIKIMISLLLQKFKDPELSSSLRATGDKQLFEGNTWGDTLWGVVDGRGRNMLGVALMEIRSWKREGKEL